MKSCNYRCPYCPFGKFKETGKQVEKDKELLDRFYQWIKNQTNEISLFITPYGEVLGKEYYWEYFAEFSKLKNVTKIGCQTNNSFSVDKAVGIFDEKKGNREKLRLWCTYHPDMVTEEKFLENCRKLDREKIIYSVGIVACDGVTDKIVSIREKLPSSVYVWLNAIEGTSYQYTENELEQLQKIDPYFQNECMRIKADIKKCIAGKEAVFIEANGDYYACHISKRKIGNIYDDSKSKNENAYDGSKEKNENVYNDSKRENINRYGDNKKDIWNMDNSHIKCQARECSCYLAYRLREDRKEYLRQDFLYRL